MRTIVISDIHGYYRSLRMLLSQVAYQAVTDRLILLGDYVDGGPAALEVVHFVQQLANAPNVHVLGGNHDEMFLKWLDDMDYHLSPYTTPKNGGLQTIRSFCPWYDSEQDDQAARAYIKEHYQHEISFLRNLPDYFEDERYIFVHAGIDPDQKHWKETSHKDFRWIRGRFYNHPGPMPMHKIIIFGHEVTARLHKDMTNFQPWFGEQMIGIDGGIKFGGVLNALIIDEDGFYQTVSVSACEEM